MSEIQNNLKKLKDSIPTNVKLVAVSKTKPVTDILEAYEAGHRIFGENRAQEMASKCEELPGDIEWHMIGHLQTNKVKYIAPFVHYVHSIDKLKLAREINKRAEENDRVINCLLQVHIAKEQQKFGFDKDTLVDVIREGLLDDMKSIRVCGLMGMATFTDDKDVVRREFQELKSLYDEVKHDFFADDDSFNILSMGMSGDYEIAIEEGSNLIRVGSLIFGPRN